MFTFTSLRRMVRSRFCIAVFVFLPAMLLAWASVHHRSAQAQQPKLEVLTSRPAVAAPEIKKMNVGASTKTAAAQRLLTELPDGSLLFVNENTKFTLQSKRELRLAAGEIFLETRHGGQRKNPAVAVKTPFNTIDSAGGSFAVQMTPAGPGVLVTRGSVKVSGLAKPLVAGQQYSPLNKKASAAPRPSHVLSWTRDLMSAAEAPLVPGSDYAGGSLIAVDPNGQETKLSLRKYRIDVYIEDGFARTTIDQTYFNHEPQQLEGTFYFPLPPDASLSRLAMYVDGQLMEGGMMVHDEAHRIYESIKYLKRDPALLEWVDGSTFKMRIFPIEGRQEKRILLSYTQKLTSLYGRLQYRFPAGHSLPAVKDWSLGVRVKNCAAMSWDCPSHQIRTKTNAGDLLLSSASKNALFNKDVVLEITDPALAAPSEKVRLAMTEHEGHRYLLVKLRPNVLRPSQDDALLAQATSPKNWLFLFESSGDRDPLLARVQIEIIRHLLEQANPQDTFNVLSANTRVRAWDKSPQPVTPENIQAAMEFLERSHLIGALDLGQALKTAARAGKESNTYIVHTGSGIAAMGERRQVELAKSIPKGARYIGIGVGKRWNRSLMKLAAEGSGGYFTQINPDESITWRTFELTGILQTLGPAGLRQAEITGLFPTPKEQPRFLYFNELLAQGEELCAVTRLDAKAALPKNLRVKFADGREANIPVQNILPNAGYLPRMWAKLEIDRLLAANPLKHKDEIIALSKDMYVMTPFTSLLVLENDDMYKEYKVDRNRKDFWALYPAPKKIAVVYEPDPAMRKKPKGAKTAEEVLDTIVVRPQPGVIAVAQAESLLGSGIKSSAARVGELVIKDDTFGPDGPIKMQQFVNGTSTGGFHVVVANPLDLAGWRGYKIDVIQQQSAGSNHYFLPLLQPPATDKLFRLESDMSLQARLIDFSASPALWESEDLRQIPVEFRRFWKNDHPSHMTYETIHGGVGPNGDSPYYVQTMHMPFKAVPTGGIAGITFFTSHQALSGLLIPERRYLVSEIVDLRELSQAQKKLLLKDFDADNNSANLTGPMSLVEYGKLNRDSLLYSRPSYSENVSVFLDLLSYAPGMNTNMADIRGVVEREAWFGKPLRDGAIDAGVRELFAKARKKDWYTLSVKGEDGKPSATVVFDGKGRFAYEQASPLGIKEQVACDGETLLHLYPQLGLAAKRKVSRFHRSSFSAMLPSMVVPPEDLAKGADLKLIAPRTVEVVPHRSKVKPAKDKDGKELPIIAFHLRMIFGEDGALAEKQLVLMPKNKVILRQVLGADGTVKLISGKGKELSVFKGKLTPASPPNLSPDVKNLIVLDLPYRTPAQVRETLKLKDKSHGELTFAEATALLAAYAAAGDGDQARDLFQSALQNRKQRQIGYYVLLAACGQNLDAEHLNVLEEHPDHPLAQYLALHTSKVLRQHASQWAVNSVQWKEPFLRHLAVTHALYQRWRSKQPEKWTPDRLKKEREQALQYVRDNKNSAFGWVMLCLMQDKAGKDEQFYAQLAEHWKLFADSALGYAARYEHARCLWKAGKAQPARQAFAKLYTDTLKEGALPAIDTDFRAALVQGSDAGAWMPLLQQSAEKLIKDDRRLAALALAWQCWELNDVPQANQLLSLAMKDIKEEKERQAMQLVAVQFYRKTAQLPQADQMLQKLLNDPKLAQLPQLWRLAARIAEARSMDVRRMQCLAKALDLEFKNLPPIINADQVREDYGALLEYYEGLGKSIIALKIDPPADFVSKVVRTADRWRSLDPKAGYPSNITAGILRTLGDKDLSWDYLTTPIAMQPNESEPWLNLANELKLSGDLHLADLAYKAAFEAEPTDAQILWDRAQNLEHAGKTASAQALYRQIVDGEWSLQHQGLVTQAKLRIK